MDSIDEETHTPAEFYSAFSNAVYKDDTPAMEEELERQGVKGWKRDEEISNHDRSVFYRKKRNKDTGEDAEGYDVVFSNRGTSETRNLLPDVAIAFGAEGKTKRYMDLKTDYRRAKSKYNNENDNLVVTGHSLGGNQATFLNRHFNVESHAYNPGASLSHLTKGFVNKIACWANPSYSDCKQADKSHIYHVPGDPLSTASIFGRDNKHIHKWRKGASQPHSLSNFLKVWE